MQLQILSDIHLEFEAFEVDTSAADVVVLAGDIHVGDKGVQWALEHIKDVPVIYVLGNHEYYRQIYPKLPRKLKQAVQGSHVHILENECLNIEGVNFYGATLWTDFALFGDPRAAGYECQQVMTDFKRIRREPNYSKLRTLDAAMIHGESVNWLARTFDQNSKNNVVVTHHAPSLRSIPAQYQDDLVSAAYASNLDQLVETLNPALWIHGHVHESRDYLIGSTRVVCNPRGYPSERNVNFDPGLLVSL